MKRDARVYDVSFENLLALAERAFASCEWSPALLPFLEPTEGLFAAAENGPRPEPRHQWNPAPSMSSWRDSPLRLFDLAAGVWMSEEGLEATLLSVAAKAGRLGSAHLANLTDPDVRRVHRACFRVRREIERLVGFARFRPGTDGLFVAALEPDANVVPALFARFLDRFASQDFAVVDTARRIACEKRGRILRGLAGPDALAVLPEGSGDATEALWRRYYDAIAIPQRSNPELRRRLMPIRYWKHLPEIGGTEG